MERLKKHHGLKSVLKEIVDRLLFEQSVKRPKKIMIELSSMLDDKDAPSIATVEQITNFLRYRRLKLVDKNYMEKLHEGVNSFLKSHTYHKNYDLNIGSSHLVFI